MYLKIALLALLMFLKFTEGIVKEAMLESYGSSTLFIDAFSFDKNGIYDFEINSNRPTKIPELLLLFVDKGTNCDSIGKTCIYKLFRMEDICAKFTAIEFQKEIFKAYPILIPSFSYLPNRVAASSITFNSDTWDRYIPTSTLSIRNHMKSSLIPAIVSKKEFKIVKLDPSLHIEKLEQRPHIKSILTTFSETVKETTTLYFGILSCSTEPITLHVKYTLLNPKGEQLPLTKIPYKVSYSLY